MNTGFKDPRTAFEDAIECGVLTKDTAADYMYMYTDPIHGDAFKNIITRQYVWNPNESDKVTGNVQQITETTTAVDNGGRIIRQTPFMATCAEFLGMTEQDFQASINKIN